MIIKVPDKLDREFMGLLESAVWRTRNSVSEDKLTKNEISCLKFVDKLVKQHSKS